LHVMGWTEKSCESEVVSKRGGRRRKRGGRRRKRSERGECGGERERHPHLHRFHGNEVCLWVAPPSSLACSNTVDATSSTHGGSRTRPLGRRAVGPDTAVSLDDVQICSVVQMCRAVPTNTNAHSADSTSSTTLRDSPETRCAGRRRCTNRGLDRGTVESGIRP
jgi:hypothetical protein